MPNNVRTSAAKKRVESILDFQLICHLHSGTYCNGLYQVCKHFVPECK